MPKVVAQQNNFTRGQLSRSMRGRNDLDFYYAGVEQQLNFISDVQGSSRYRTGSIFLGETKDNNPAWLYEFVFNESEAYVLEFTDGYLRFWTPDGIVGAPLELTTPYAEADLPQLQIAQFADTMYIAHKNYHPKILTRTGSSTFTLEDHTLAGSEIPDGMDWTNADNYPAAVTIYEKRLWYAGSDAKPQTIFGSQSFLYNNFDQGDGLDDEGVEYQIGSERLNRIRWMSPTSSRVVVGTSGGNFDMQGGSASDPITPSSISVRSSGSRGVAELRPVKRDNTIIYVQSGLDVINSYAYSYEADSYTPTDRTILSDDILSMGVTHISFRNGKPDSMYATLEDGTAAVLVWKPEQQVYAWCKISTLGDYISFASIPQPLGDDNLIQCVKRVIDGNEKHYIELVSQEVSLPQFEDYFTGDKEADELAYRLASYEAQKGYIHVDSCLTYDGSALSTGATLNIAVGSPSSITATASVFADTYVGRQIRAKQGEGWATITAYVSATEVEVTINTDFDESSYADGDWYLTAGGASGLDHLEGETVSICVDGATNEDRVVEGGVVTLSDDGKRQGSVIHIGLPYTGILKSMNIEGGSQNGTSQAKRKVLSKVNILFMDSLGAKFGTDIYKLDELLFQSTGNRTNRPPEPFSGYKETTAFDRTQKIKRWFVVQDRPLPCIIQQVIPELNTTN